MSPWYLVSGYLSLGESCGLATRICRRVPKHCGYAKRDEVLKTFISDHGNKKKAATYLFYIYISILLHLQNQVLYLSDTKMYSEQCDHNRCFKLLVINYLVKTTC